jgi:histone H3/H4
MHKFLPEAEEVMRGFFFLPPRGLRKYLLGENNDMAKPKFTYFVKKAVQDFARANKMMVGSDAYDAINVQIDAMLKEASARCKANKRKTLKAYDF